MMKKQLQRGFTLVEIAIVLVIIGLLLGGALKGQEMIQNAKIKNIKRDFDQYVAAFYSYQDRYRTLAGDDAAADTHVGGTKPAANKAGNGFIDTGAWDTDLAASDANESGLFWEHIRAAGLISGSGANLPTNAMGGKVGIGYGLVSLTNSHVFCFSGIEAETAVILDASYDDGDAKTGAVRGIGGDNGALTDKSDYTGNYKNQLCFQI
ncbi:type II secretion system protein [Marinobacterium arenosum]|uniref:type II secretion system protein n=1 Tax=Marinobacterium arenosum TaxID=2862496 RepID=UPI001C980DF9|nr:prepilin-type N-terminal cleavage/methylation domain-containing protein [Marinobacterium arenosum]MBY4676520.1 prepilin-type N-terminal cleavage/methylation domain-containing protein [Marinobacterium arenosum]